MTWPTVAVRKQITRGGLDQQRAVAVDEQVEHVRCTRRKLGLQVLVVLYHRGVEVKEHARRASGARADDVVVQMDLRQVPSLDRLHLIAEPNTSLLNIEIAHQC